MWISDFFGSIWRFLSGIQIAALMQKIAQMHEQSISMLLLRKRKSTTFNGIMSLKHWQREKAIYFVPVCSMIDEYIWHSFFFLLLLAAYLKVGRGRRVLAKFQSRRLKHELALPRVECPRRMCNGDRQISAEDNGCKGDCSCCLYARMLWRLGSLAY
jgi:hypothetical protein